MNRPMKNARTIDANQSRLRGRHLLAILACVLVCALAVPALQAIAAPIKGTLTQDGVTYSYTIEEGEATITHIAKAEDNASDTYEAVIPDSITDNGKSYLVVALADNVMGTKYQQGKAPITDSALTRVVLPAKLLKIGNQAFAECLALSTVEFAAEEDGTQHLESIGDYAFCESAVVDLQLPDTLVSAGQQAFYKMPNLRTLKLPATRTEWGISAFESTLHVQQLSIPEGAVAVPKIQFDGAKVDIPSSVEGEVNITASNATQVSISPQANITALNLKFGSCPQLVVPETVTELGLSGACPKVVFPKNLRIITRYGITGSSTLEVPASVEQIATMAFQGNSSLRTITFEQGSKLTEIEFYAFLNCSKLETIQLPEGLQTLNLNAFKNCDALTSLTIPATVSAVNYYVESCGSLQSIEIASGSQLRTIARIAKDCTSLKKVVLPSGLQKINRASSALMSGCAALEDVIVYNPNLQLQDSDFENCGNFKVYGWGTEGKLLDFAESAGYEFVPLAELDDSAYNGVSNTKISLQEDGKPQVVTQFSSEKGYNYSRLLINDFDYSLARIERDGVTYWQVQGNNATTFGTATIAAAQSIQGAQIAPIATQLYSGAPCQPKPVVTLGGRTLSEGADYTLSYANNEQPGTATVTVSGAGGYTGSISATFAVASALSVTQTDRTAIAAGVAPEQAVAVVIAWAWDTASVASASAFSATTGYPLVAVSNRSLTTDQLSQLRAWGTKTAYVVGGLDACGKTVADQLQKAGVECNQIAGANVAETSLALVGSTQAWGRVAVVANPEYPALAVAAGAFAGAGRAPLVYTNPDGTLSAQALETLQSFDQVILAGDLFQIDSAVQTTLTRSVRVSGNGDAATSLALASYAQQAGWYQAGPLYASSVADAPTQATWAANAGKAKSPFVVVDLSDCESVATWARDNAQTVQGYLLLQRETGTLDPLANLLQAANQ